MKQRHLHTVFHRLSSREGCQDGHVPLIADSNEMLDKLTSGIDFHAKALTLRAERQQVLSSNIANADTPGFKARDFDFSAALAQQVGSANESSGSSAASRNRGALVLTTDPRHLSGSAQGSAGAADLTTLKFRTADQASLDGNTVNLDVERANFAENSMRYEAALRFINGNVRRTLSAIRGE